MIIWWSVCALVTAVWVGRWMFLTFAGHHQLDLRADSHPPPGPDAPLISILVAGKDEAANIEECVLSILAQDYPRFEVIVINDRSTDQTGPILDRLSQTYPNKLRVIHVKELPAGWGGKNHAMSLGVAEAGGLWLCFTDADCSWLSSRLLGVSFQEAVQTQADFLSVLPVLKTKTFWEHVLQPVCGAVMAVWFPPTRVNNPQSPVAYANGAYMLMSRAAYDTLGGHLAVRNELNEDIQFARLAKTRGLKLRVATNDHLYHVRMYDSLRACWRGWSRIFYGSFKTTGRVLAALGMISLFSIFPWLSLLASILGRFLDSENRAWLIGFYWSMAMILLMQITMFRFYQVARVSAAWALTYSLGAFVCTGMLWTALLKVWGASQTTWRGTTYIRPVADIPK